MKKIPTLFTRIYEGHRIVGIKDEITPGCEDAFKNGIATIKVDGSRCAIINGNPYNLSEDKLVKHGMELVYVKRDFKSISNWLNENPVEGLVFWLDGEPVCKIKRSDFGYEWPVKGGPAMNECIV